MVVLNKPLCTITQLFPFILNRNVNSFRKAATLITIILLFLNQQPHIKFTPLSYNLFNYLKMNTLYWVLNREM